MLFAVAGQGATAVHVARGPVADDPGRAVGDVERVEIDEMRGIGNAV